MHTPASGVSLARLDARLTGSFAATRSGTRMTPQGRPAPIWPAISPQESCHPTWSDSIAARHGRQRPANSVEKLAEHASWRLRWGAQTLGVVEIADHQAI